MFDAKEHADNKGLHVHIESFVGIVNFHERFYPRFAEWLYAEDRTEAEVLDNLRSLVYIAMVDGMALYRALGECVSAGDLMKAQQEGKVYLDDVCVKQKQNNILAFPVEQPELHDTIVKALVTGLNVQHLRQPIQNMEWDWYKETRKSNGD